MSVLACSRRGCDNVMCHRRILGVYICEDCHAELQEAVERWPDRMAAVDVREAVERFMDTRPGTAILLDRQGIREEVARLTKVQRYG